MADFDDFENSHVDPAADFLAREQDQLAGIEDDEILNTEQNDNNLEQAAGDGFQNGETETVNVDLSEQFQTNGPTDQYSTISSLDTLNSEPEKIRKWREEHKERLEEKDREEEKKKEEWKEIARKELEDWKKHHTEQLEKSKATNRETEAEFVKERDQTVPGQEWERVARLCDFNPKSSSKNVKDVSRMRSILLHLKQSGLKRE